MHRSKEEENLMRVIDDLVSGDLGTDNITMDHKKAEVVLGLFHKLEGRNQYLERWKHELVRENCLLRGAVSLGCSAALAIDDRKESDRLHSAIKDLEEQANGWKEKHRDRSSP